jgi:hypothetical protein
MFSSLRSDDLAAFLRVVFIDLAPAHLFGVNSGGVKQVNRGGRLVERSRHLGRSVSDSLNES